MGCSRGGVSPGAVLEFARHLVRICPALLVWSSALAAQDFTVRTNIPAQGFVSSDSPIELTFSRALDAQNESVAVFIGATDFTGLFRPSGSGLLLTPRLVELPSGDSPVTVYLIDATGSWNEVASETLRVEGALGFQSREVTPKLDVAFKSQPWEGKEPDPGTDFPVTGDLDGKISFQVEQVHSGFKVGLNSLFLGFNHQENALRFREKGEDAYKVDLSNYDLEYGSEKLDVSLGHVRTGNQRYLISGFGARGATATLRPVSRVDAQVGVTNGSSIVGFDNIVGLDDSDHRMLNASLGVEALETPGQLRMEFSYLDASKLPRNNFNQGAVNDAERSEGFGFNFKANGLGRRLRLDGGFSRSRFDNPDDPALDQGQAVVAVREETKNARYLNANLDVLKNVKLGGGKTAGLSVGYKHERVDPLYKSVGASARADQLHNQYDLRADVAGVAVQVTYSDANDNLDELASVLKSNTERAGLNVGVPLPNIFRGKAGVTWLPALQYRMQRTHQFGEEIPVNGGFSAGHVPDQVSTNHTASAGWRWRKVNFSYQLNFSKQDNRQEGREDADLNNAKSGFSLGLNPTRTLSVTLDLGFEEAENIQRDEIDNTRRFGARINWKPIQRSTLGIQFSDTFKDDQAATKEQSDNRLDVNWSGAVPRTDRFNGQYYVRYSRNVAERMDVARNTDDRRENWTVNTGFSFSFGGR